MSSPTSPHLAKTKQKSLIRSNTRQRKSRFIRPIPQLCWVTSDPDPMRVGRRWPVEDEEHEPARGANPRIRRGGNGAHVSLARECREDRSAAHRVPMRARCCCMYMERKECEKIQQPRG